MLAALYAVGEIGNTCCTGAFDGVGHVTALLDFSMDRAVRCCLLRLLESLLAPEASRQDEKAGRVAAANGRAFVEAGGVQPAVDLVAGQVLTSSRKRKRKTNCNFRRQFDEKPSILPGCPERQAPAHLLRLIVHLCSHCSACYLCVCMII